MLSYGAEINEDLRGRTFSWRGDSYQSETAKDEDEEKEEVMEFFIFGFILGVIAASGKSLFSKRLRLTIRVGHPKLKDKENG